MRRSFYVDDLATGENCTENAYSLFTKAKKRMSEGGFNLRKWRTNDRDLRKQIDKQKLEQNSSDESEPTYAKTTLACQAGSQVDKVLGLEWDCVGDIIKFDFGHLLEKAKNLEPSKRNVLSLLACIFDPLGLLSPTIVKAKILFQEICVSGLDWDDILGRSLRVKWEKWLNDLRETKEVIVERYARKQAGNLAQKVEAKHWLHGFGDASKKAYCAVIYLVTEENGKTYCKLIASKTRVAPIKELTIPRLELMAARILAQLMQAVSRALESEYKFEGKKYWTDSKTTLCWIRNAGEWKQFVRHRVDEILKLTNKQDWGHCPGRENPADLGSRGILVSELKNSKLWWSGPEWLTGSPSDWPQLEDILPTPESKEEEKKFTVNVLLSVDSLSGIMNLMKLAKFSSLTRLLRVTAWIKRFVTNLKKKVLGNSIDVGSLKGSELREAELEWIKASQVELKDRDSYGQLKRQYGLVEKDGILRCTGRLGNSDLVIEAKEPIVLPKNHMFTELVIKHCHDCVMHGGVRSTLAQLRSRYWVPKGRQEVKRVLARCLICRKWNCKSYTPPQQTALPKFRVTRAAPFENSGVDFAGPLFVKAKDCMSKVYIALFTCCVTRAVHLELVQDLAAPTFLRCLRRFTSRRGTPKIMVSDNAKTFKAANRVLRELYDSAEVKDCLSNKGIDWRFNLERAPWWGGFFERLIGLVKTCLRRVIGNARLTFDELRTILVEVEATLNDRPLTYEYDEVSSEVLTPSHLIYGRRITSLADGNTGEYETKSNSIARFKYLGTLLEHFWNRWRREYLTNLREFHKEGRLEKKGSVAVKAGDVVIVYEQGKKRGEWKTGIVQEFIAGADGVVRGAKVQVVTKGRKQVISRAVQHLYPMEVRCSEYREDDRVAEDKNQVVEKKGIEKRARRSAALDARWKTKAMLDS